MQRHSQGALRPWWRCPPLTTSTSSRTISASSRSWMRPATSPAGTSPSAAEDAESAGLQHLRKDEARAEDDEAGLDEKFGLHRRLEPLRRPDGIADEQPQPTGCSWTGVSNMSFSPCWPAMRRANHASAKIAGKPTRNGTRPLINTNSESALSRQAQSRQVRSAGCALDFLLQSNQS